jgi:hypothetical protein
VEAERSSRRALHAVALEKREKHIKHWRRTRQLWKYERKLVMQDAERMEAELSAAENDPSLAVDAHDLVGTRF